MAISSLLLFASVYFLAVASPGPGVAAVVARGLGQGMAAGPAFVAGFIVGDLIWFAVAATGLSVIAQSFATLFLAVKYAGCAYLLWLAWKIWNAPATPGTLSLAAGHARSWPSFLGSLALTLGNPKVIVFFVSLMPLVSDVKDMSPLVFAQLAAVIAVVIGTVMSFMLVAADRARRMLTSPKILRRVNRVTAGVMAGAATVIASRS